MMKKLLILMLVLGLASAASAVPVGYSLWVAPDPEPYPSTMPPAQEDYYEAVSSQIILYPSDTLWIGVYNSIAGEPGDTRQHTFYLAFLDTEDGEWTGEFAQYKPPLVADAPANTYYGIFEGLDIWELALDDGNPEHFNGIGVLDAKQFHCTGPESEVEVVLLDNDLTTILDSFIIHQLPEPMTITLLGLGGLLLRRRK